MKHPMYSNYTALHFAGAKIMRECEETVKNILIRKA